MQHNLLFSSCFTSVSTMDPHSQVPILEPSYMLACESGKKGDGEGMRGEGEPLKVYRSPLCGF